MVIWGYIGSLAYGIVCLLISLLAYRLGMPKRYTRKIVHILVGFEWVILYHLMGVGIHFVAVALIFTAMLFVSYKKSLMPMISSDNDNAPGTVYYGISMSIMAIISCFVEGFVFAFGIAVFCTSIGDGLAAVIGSSVSKFNPKIYKNKTLLGTLSAFAFSFASTYVFSLIYSLELAVWHCLLIAVFAAGLEIATGFGLDNITLPAGTAALAFLLMNVPGTENYLFPIIATPFIVVLALGKKLLTVRGVLFALVLDVAVSLSLGNFGFTLLLSFLLLSVLVDKLKKCLRQSPDAISKRGERRDEIQVIANGAVPALLAVFYLFTGNALFIVAYSASLAECFADTCASGFGALSKNAFDVFRMKSVTPGLSGGMSLIGTLASVIAPFAFCAISLAFGVIDLKWWIICSIAATVGAFFDSFLGSVFQAKYKCLECGIITEKTEHCSSPCALVSGKAFLNNDLVNLFSVAFSAALTALLYVLI